MQEPVQEFPITDITCGHKWSKQDIMDWCKEHDHPISAEEIIEKIEQDGASLSIENNFLTWVE